MRVGKIIFALTIVALAVQAGFSQSRDEIPFSAERTDSPKLVQLYPNPTSEYLNVKFDTPCAKKIKLTLHNIIGNVLEVETEVIDDHELQLKVRDLPSGYYLLSIRDPETNLGRTFKFLKR